MSEKAKKIINIVIIAIIVLLLVALAVFYFFFFKPGQIEPSAPGGSFPFVPGGNQAPGGEEVPTGTTTPIYTPGQSFKPILRRISATPVGGGIIFEKDGKQTVRYIDRGVGNVFETDAEKIAPQKITANPIPKVYESYWKKDGSALVARYLKDDSDRIETFYGEVRVGANGQGELKGNYLSSSIKDVAISPNGNRIFYISSGGGAVGIVSTLDGASRFQIFDSALSFWLPLWPKENTAVVVSKAGGGDVGSLYFVDTGTGRYTPVITNVQGLTGNSNPSAEKVLYSESNGLNLTNKIFNVKTKTASPFVLTTMPEKCVWSQKNTNIVFCAVPSAIPSATYPDDWYQGEILFNDEIWKIDTDTGANEFIMNLEDNAKEKFDAVSIQLNAKENFLHFINKYNLSYWSLQIEP